MCSTFNYLKRKREMTNVSYKSHTQTHTNTHTHNTETRSISVHGRVRSAGFQASYIWLKKCKQASEYSNKTVMQLLQYGGVTTSSQNKNTNKNKTDEQHLRLRRLQQYWRLRNTETQHDNKKADYTILNMQRKNKAGDIYTTVK